MDPTQLSNKLSLQYMEALNNTIQLNGVPQIVQPYIVWDWGGKSYPLGSIPYQQVSALDLVPNDPMANSQNQTGAAGTGFGGNYSLFLNFINPTPQQTDPTYQQYQQQLTNDSRSLYTTQQNAQIAFKNFVNSSHSSETYQDWLANEGASYKAQLSAASQTVTQDTAQLTAYAKALGGPITAAQTAYTNGLLQIQDQSGNAVTVAPWETSEIPYDYVNQITNNNFGGDATNGSARSFSIDQSTSEYSNSEVWGEAGGGGFLDWLGIEVGGEFKQVNTSSFASNYSIKFSFQDLSTIQVTPGSWYEGAMLTNYNQGPFFSGHSGFKSGNDIYYFGENGNLARIYTAMVVGYRPTIDLNAGNEFASYFQQQISAEATVWIGPFAFGGSGGSEETKGSVEINGADITATSKGSWPYIVAMVSNWTVAPPG